MKVLTWQDIRAPRPPRDYLVADLGLVGGGGAPHILVGFGGSRKTWAAQGLAVSLACGLPIWGRFNPAKMRKVMYVDLEQGETLTCERFVRLARGMHADEAALNDNIGLVTSAELRGVSLSRAHQSTWAHLMTGRDLILIDSFRVAMRGADENDSAIRDGLDLLGEMSDITHCRAVVLHHSKKGTPEDDDDLRFQARGSGAIYDGADGMYNFYAKGTDPTLVKHIKYRTHGRPVEPFSLTVDDLSDGTCRVRAEDEDYVEEAREDAKEARKAAKGQEDIARIRSALQEASRGLGREELRTAAKLGEAAFKRAVEELTARGDLRILAEKRGRGTVAIHVWNSGGKVIPMTDLRTSGGTSDNSD